MSEVEPSTPSLTPTVNTHVHLPPNFSAFATIAEALDEAQRQRVAAVGISNFYDQQVYPMFGDAARERSITPLFGLEFITLVRELEAAGVRVNDPANPGRMYLCGKGIDASRRGGVIDEVAQRIRRGNDERAVAMVARLAQHLTNCGLDTGLDADAIAADVAARSDVPVAWVSLQERHIANAFGDAIAVLPADVRDDVLTRAYGGPPKADAADAVALQGEIRSRLLKAGKPGFVPEVPLDFETARDHVLARDGIPCYPTLADGIDPVCEFEADPKALAASLLERGIHAAELIANRNTSATLDRYVQAFTAAGLIVMAGTEHNTAQRIPFAVTCADGPVSDASMALFWQGCCVVAGHRYERDAGRPGFVRGDGTPDRDAGELAGIGAVLLGDPR